MFDVEYKLLSAPYGLQLDAIFVERPPRTISVVSERWPSGGG
jgi:hypothetical protein